jgi:predicted nuclease of predicted toxin-antitoxin system
MRLLADMHIAPRTVRFLRSLGHDVVRVDELLLPTATDEAIMAAAVGEERCIVTQDLDFSATVALSGRTAPSVISLRLSSSRVEQVNAVLQEVLPGVENDLLDGAIVTVQESLKELRRIADLLAQLTCACVGSLNLGRAEAPHLLKSWAERQEQP